MVRVIRDMRDDVLSVLLEAAFVAGASAGSRHLMAHFNQLLDAAKADGAKGVAAIDSMGAANISTELLRAEARAYIREIFDGIQWDGV